MRNSSRPWLVVLSLALAGAGLVAVAPASAADNTMKTLMKKMGATAANEDAKALVPMLAQARAMKPADPEFAGWDAIIDAGKAAAEKGDLTAAKASCKDCHTKYRDSYKTRFGSKAP